MFINDPVHGFRQLSDIQESLIELPELQRLQWIKQLGLSFLSYPGGTHTRFSHALGVSHIAGMMAQALGLSEEDQRLTEAAGLLHDVGHTPFSHTLESLLPIDHMDWTRSIINGSGSLELPGSGRIPEILSKHGLAPDDVGALVNSDHPSPILQNVIHGNIDADQLDYLPRDAYFCGITHGQIDLYRILHTLVKDEQGNELLLLEKGIDAIEEMLVARDHMYSAVYAHKTGRIAEMMLLKAMKTSIDDIPTFHRMTDGELINKLLQARKESVSLVERIMYRRLYKSAYVIMSSDEEKKEPLVKLLKEHNPREIEAILSAGAGLPGNEVIVDTPVEVLKFSEPRLKQVEIGVVTKNGKIKQLRELSPLARALEKKESTHVLFAVFTPEEKRGSVQIIAEELVDSFA